MARAHIPYFRSSSVTGASKRVERRGVLLSMAGVFLALASSASALAAAPSDIRLDAVESQAYSEATRLFGEKRWEDGAIVLRGILRRNPDVLTQAPSVVMDLAKALAYSGRREEALSLLGQALSREKKAAQKQVWAARIRLVSRLFLTNSAFQLYQDGVNLLDAGKASAAREKFEKALEREPHNIEILLRLGQCLVVAGDDDSAAERLRLARKLNPYEPEISLWLGRALHHRGELDQALAELRFAADQLPASELAPLWYAEALTSAGRRQQAVQWLESAIERNPMNLSLLIASAKAKAEDAAGIDEGRKEKLLWSARKDLQLALSRLTQASTQTSNAAADELEQRGSAIAPASPTKSKDDLDFEPKRTASEIKDEIFGLQQKVDKALSVDRSA